MTVHMRRLSFGITMLVALSSGSAQGHEKVADHAHRVVRPQQVKISVTQAGFAPASIKVKKGVPILLIITRKTDKTCATQAVFASLGKTVDLPLNKAVRVELPAQPEGRLSYACGMGMYQSELVVQ